LLALADAVIDPLGKVCAAATFRRSSASGAIFLGDGSFVHGIAHADCL
jgi:hypothetical protein